MFLRAIFAILSISAFALFGYGREIYNDKLVDMSPGTISVDSLPDNFSDCSYHLRVEIPKRCYNPEWSVTLHYADGTFSIIDLQRPGSAIADIDYGLPINVSLTDWSADSILLESEEWNIAKDIDPTKEGWSITLTQLSDASDMICSIGQSKPLLAFPVKSEGLKTISSYSSSNIRLSRLSLFATETDDLTNVCVGSLDELSERLDNTGESIEGYWRYLDRDTDPRRLNTAGNYCLATVIAPDKTIEIIYLDGVTRNKDNWQPLMLKGRLIPTVFTNHYDLIWYDAFGAKIATETSADLIDGATLRLNFPLQGGSIRFQKSVQ